MKVLCVDDDPFMLELYAMTLADVGEVVAVASGAEALTHLEGVSAIVLDFGLPDMSGAELIEQIRARSSVPMLVVTGEEALELDAVEVMRKPVALPKLRAWVALNAR